MRARRQTRYSARSDPRVTARRACGQKSLLSVLGLSLLPITTVPHYHGHFLSSSHCLVASHLRETLLKTTLFTAQRNKLSPDHDTTGIYCNQPQRGQQNYKSRRVPSRCQERARKGGRKRPHLHQLYPKAPTASTNTTQKRTRKNRSSHEEQRQRSRLCLHSRAPITE